VDSVNRLSAIDDSVELGVLLRASDLEEVAGYYAELHGCGVAVLDSQRTGRRLAVAAGPGADVDVVRELPLDAGEIERGDRAYFRALLLHEGSPIGMVVVGPHESGSEVATERAGRLAGHIRSILEVLVHAAYQRYLTSVMHVAAMEEAYAGLQKKNEQLAQAVERLQEADRLKSNFLATVSHELRTPLTSVIGYSEMLLEGLAGALNTEQGDYVQTVLSKADQLLQLITGILDASLLENGQLDLARRIIVVAELIDAVAATYAPQAQQRSVELALDVPDVPPLFGDERKIRQVLGNLVANAIKFTDGGGRVRVSVTVGPLSPRNDAGRFGAPSAHATPQTWGVRISVADDGIGIPPEKLRHIFEPFFQVDSSSTREYGGTGLGLTLAKRYVEAHGGEIWVDSRLGHGSTFTVSFPAAPDELEAYLARTNPANVT
jgi:signal transduction histidine kinase